MIGSGGAGLVRPSGWDPSLSWRAVPPQPPISILELAIASLFRQRKADHPQGGIPGNGFVVTIERDKLSIVMDRPRSDHKIE